MGYPSEFVVSSLDMGSPFNIIVVSSPDGLVQYIGEADPGTATTEAKWRIKKKVVTIAGDTTEVITWANGRNKFENVWDNYATFTYS